LAVGGVSSFVTNSADAAIFGVNGHRRTGTQALDAGLWGTAGTLFAGVTTGLAQNLWHLTASGRLYSRSGPGDVMINGAEIALASYLAYWAEQKSPLDIAPSRPFPTAPTAPTAPTPPAPAPPTPPVPPMGSAPLARAESSVRILEPIRRPSEHRPRPLNAIGNHSYSLSLG